MKTVSIYGAITENANIIAYDITKAVENGEKDIQVRINSSGGSVNDGLSIVSAFNFARSKGAKITTIIDGIAYSMGGYIALCGDIRKCTSYSSGMLHPPYAKGIKNPDKSLVDYIEHKTENLEGLVSAMVDLKVEDLTAFIAEETFMTAQKMKENRFVTEIIPNKNINSAKISALYSENLQAFELVAKIEEIKKEKPKKTNIMAEEKSAMEEVLNKLSVLSKDLVDVKADLGKQKEIAEKFENHAIVASVKNILATKELPEGKTEADLIALAGKMSIEAFEEAMGGYPNKAVAIQKDIPTKPKPKPKENAPVGKEEKNVLDIVAEAGFESLEQMKQVDPSAYFKVLKAENEKTDNYEKDIFAEWKTSKDYK